MKREIKFRGKDISQDIWYEGSLYQDEMVSSIMFQKDGIDYNMIVDPETVGQFTGRKDTGGNEIYEGDKMGTGKIVYSEFTAAFVLIAPTWEHDLNYASWNYRVRKSDDFYEFVKETFGKDVPPFDKDDYEKLKKERQQFQNKADEQRQELLWLEVIEDCGQFEFDTMHRRNRAEKLMDKFIISKK